MKEEIVKARYRNKVGKIIIEVWNGEKWIYVKTLSNPLIEFKEECLAKVSQNKAINDEKEAQKFGQSSLTDVSKQDTQEDIIKKAVEESNKIMNDILNNKSKKEEIN